MPALISEAELKPRVELGTFLISLSPSTLIMYPHVPQ